MVKKWREDRRERADLKAWALRHSFLAPARGTGGSVVRLADTLKIRIESSGIPRDARITNADTGELLLGVQRVVLDIDIDRPRVEATVYIRGAEIDVAADATVHHLRR